MQNNNMNITHFTVCDYNDRTNNIRLAFYDENETVEILVNLKVKVEDGEVSFDYPTLEDKQEEWAVCCFIDDNTTEMDEEILRKIEKEIFATEPDEEPYWRRDY